LTTGGKRARERRPSDKASFKRARRGKVSEAHIGERVTPRRGSRRKKKRQRCVLYTEQDFNSADAPPLKGGGGKGRPTVCDVHREGKRKRSILKQEEKKTTEGGGKKEREGTFFRIDESATASREKSAAI